MRYNKDIHTVEEYIANYPDNVQQILNRVRSIIKKEAPMAMEGISYSMPAYKLNGVLLYFGAHKSHIALYPTPSAVEKFKERLLSDNVSKGTLRFSIDSSIPYNLISEIVTFRVAEQLSKK